MESLRFRTNDIITLTNNLLRVLKVKINFETLKTKLEAHPFYPTLLSVSDVLAEFKIDNVIFQMEKDQYNPSELPFPFIAYFSDNEDSFVLVHGVSNGQVSVSGKTLPSRSLDEIEFFESWTGIGLHAEAKAESAEQNFHLHRIEYAIKRSVVPACLIFLLTVFALIFNLHDFFWPNLVVLIFKLIGMIITILLLTQSIDADSPIVKRICGFHKDGNCNTLLTSKVAKITKWLNWSEIGFFYFLGSFLLFLIFPTAVIILFWLNLLALPFTLFSLIYQYRKKTWCILCCGVQALVWLEFISLEIIRYLNPHAFKFRGADVFYYLLCFIAPVLLWALLKPVLLKASLTKRIQQQLNHFKYNSDIFNQILNHQSFHIIDNHLSPILIGSPNAETVITIVSNPFCNPCRKIHPLITELLTFRSNFQVKIIFATNDDENDQRTKVARHMIALNLLNDKDLSKTAIDDWYTNHDSSYESWAKKYPVIITEQVKQVSADQKNWCKSAEIDFTPAILVNGYKLPEPYLFEDIKYLID